MNMDGQDEQDEIKSAFMTIILSILYIHVNYLLYIHVHSLEDYRAVFQGGFDGSFGFV